MASATRGKTPARPVHHCPNCGKTIPRLWQRRKTITVCVGVLLVMAGLVGGWLLTPSNVQLAVERQRLRQHQARLQQEQQQLAVVRRQLAEERQRLAEERQQTEAAKPQEPTRVAGGERTPARPEPQPPAPSPPLTPPLPTEKTWRSPTTGMDFVLIAAGKFMMGSDTGDSDEKPVHEVRISKAFYLGKHEVTQGQWQVVMGNDPSRFTGDPNLPVERVSWEDVQEFIRRLNAREGGTRYRLPTEAEWEYAARAGSTTAYSFVNERQCGEYAWHYANSEGKTHPVGQKKANSWGLYDMHGNVWEWVQDWYGPYTAGSAVDPTGPSSGSNRVFRSGQWGLDDANCRAAIRGFNPPGDRHVRLGFRLLRTAE